MSTTDNTNSTAIESSDTGTEVNNVLSRPTDWRDMSTRTADDLLTAWRTFNNFSLTDIQSLFGYIADKHAVEGVKHDEAMAEIERCWLDSPAYDSKKSDSLWTTAEAGWRKGVAARKELPRYVKVEDGVTPALAEFMAANSTSSANMTTRVGKPEWMIEGVFERDTYTRIVGKWNHGKSMMLLSMAAAVATGQPWMGHPTRKGTVVYMVAEGAQGWAQRLRAWEQTYNNGVQIPESDLHVWLRPINVDDDKAWSMFVAACKVWGADWVILDTQAKITRGIDEQGPSLSILNEKCDKLRFATGATVTLLHHPGHGNEKRGRGWSGISTDLDTELYLWQEKTGKVAVSFEKVRDGRKLDTIAPMRIVETMTGGTDDDGDPITAGLIIPWDAPAPTVEKALLPAAVELPEDVLSYAGRGSILVPALAAYIASQGGSTRAAALRGISKPTNDRSGINAWDWLRTTDYLKPDNADENEALGYHKWTA